MLNKKSILLTIELVPTTAWYSNVRSNVTTSQWNKIRKKCYALASNKCEICGNIGTNQGTNYKVACHEIWEYNDKSNEQILKGFIALCPNCHSTKHVGLAQIKGYIETVIVQLMKVNTMTRQEAKNYIDESFEIWMQRSQHEWVLNMEILYNYLSL
jgi:hypothetical protein